MERDINSVAYGLVSGKIINEAILSWVGPKAQAVYESLFTTTETTETLLVKLDEFRANVGAAYSYLDRSLDQDIERAYKVSGSFWKCFWVSVFTRSLRTQKYYPICGKATAGFGANVTQLANLPCQEELVGRWKLRNWRAFVDDIWSTKNRLIDKEREYRNATVAIVQIGVGIGGALLGLIGLVLSFMVPLVMR